MLQLVSAFFHNLYRSLMNPTWSVVKLAIRRQFPQVRQVSTAELSHWLTQPSIQPPLLFDIRSEQEFAVSHLANAQRIDPSLDDFTSLSVPLDAAITPKGELLRIVTYCSVGYRSAAMCDRLQRAGFSNVANLEGSIFEWANTGYPVYREGHRVQQVHPYNPLWGVLLDRELHTYQPE